MSLEQKKFSKILVAIDGSESSMKAADYAIEIASHNQDAQVVILNVIVSQLGYAYSSGFFGHTTSSTIDEFLQQSKGEAQKWFDEIQQKANERNVNVKKEMVASPTAVVQAIVDYAEKNSIDLIVLGTRGRSGFKKLLLGSVASGVVTYASCPVMVVK